MTLRAVAALAVFGTAALAQETTDSKPWRNWRTQPQVEGTLPSEINWGASVRQLDSLRAARGSALLFDFAAQQGSVCPYTWTRDLQQGSSGPDVLALQRFLNSFPDTRVADWGVGSPGQETDFFGPATEAAVNKFQLKYRNEILAGLAGPTGTFGPRSREKANALCAGSSPSPSPAPSGGQLVTMAQATSVFQRSPTAVQLDDLNRCLRTFAITTKPRIRHFLAQVGHESGGLRWMKELATGDAYEGRLDLGNTQPGDGRRFKGAGAIQLTGRSNYQAFANYIGDQRVMQGVDYVADVYPFTSAGFWWYRNGMNALVDSGATVRQVSARVNGWDPANGLADREAYYARALQVI